VGVALHLGIVATALPYSLFSMGIGIVPVAKAYTLTLTEPLTACILGVLLLGERLSFTSIAGIFFIFSGLALLSLKKKGEIKDNGG
jgi:DME family drug/metabolite transporter